MNGLVAKAFCGLLFLVLVMGTVIFGASGTFGFWQGWVLLAVFGGSSLGITLYLMKNDPKLLERRVQSGPTAEKQINQKIIQSIASVGFVATLAIPVLCHRYKVTIVPSYVSVIGDLLVAAGFLVIFLVYKENSFTSATIDVYRGQTVVCTGPYGLLRNPMYMGALLLFIGIPLALGAWGGLATLTVMTPVLVFRLFEEEKFLVKNLSGYAEYRQNVRYRLLPYVW
jgi:protein-S-isoprenylcysteine O-methyltransferase Ste14